MTKKLTKMQMQPIMNILRAKKEEEFKNLKCGDIVKKLKEAEAKNEKLYAAAMKKIDMANDLLEEAGKEIGKVNKSVGRDLYYAPKTITLSRPHYYGNNGRSTYYDGTYYFVTQEQHDKITDTLDKVKKDIEMKYNLLEAKVVLADDFDSIAEILKDAGIEIDSNPVKEVI